MKFTARDALNWLDSAELYGSGSEVFSGVGTDTRRLPPGCLFVPLRGENFDAHNFIEKAVAEGAAGFLFEHCEQLYGPALRVPDTRRALGQLARGWRARFDLPLIAVTGSNGKTTVKDMISAVLAESVGAEHCLATEGNFNNDIGVPLTVFRLDDCHRVAVLELGMNHPGEIEWLTKIAQPAIAIVNNAQREHQEFLDGVEATARENGAVFSGLPESGIAVFPGDDPCTPIWEALAGNRRVMRFGLSDISGQFDVWANPAATPQAFDVFADGDSGLSSVEVKLQIDGGHNVRNALAATAACIAADIDLQTIAAGLAKFQPANGRMQRVASAVGADLINDTYNANPDSVLAAIDVLASKPVPRILVLGDMAEVGDKGPLFHREVGEYARARGLQAIFATGPLSRETVKAFGKGAVHFKEIDALSSAIRRFARPGASILVKGSRSMRMERVIDALGQDNCAAEVTHAA
ncbi:MAG: UDP-N-acetylmuramoyl-tripeptide--D-alanyl-D-alanine ligase [Burkholderiaceae bacterium]